MALTTQQQTSILQLSQVMFNTTPGAIFLDALGAQMIDGKSFADLAQFLSGTNLFFGHIYNDDFPSSFANNFVVKIKTDLRERLFNHILALGPPTPVDNAPGNSQQPQSKALKRWTRITANISRS